MFHYTPYMYKMKRKDELELKLYKNMKTGEVKNFPIRGSFEEKYVIYEDTDVVLEELDDGTKIYEQKEVEKTRTRVFYCHNDEDHFETKEWFEDIFIKFNEVESVDDIEYKEVRLSKEQRTRLENEEVQNLSEGDLHWAFQYVKDGTFPVDEDGLPFDNHPLKYLEDRLKLNEASELLLKGYEEMLSLSDSSVKILMENEELSDHVNTLSSSLIKLHEENLELSKTISNLLSESIDG